MNYKIIAKNNIKNSFGLYKNYFVSLSIVLALFNTLQIFAKDHVIADSLSGSAKVEFMSYVTSVLFTLFTIFFIIYFNRFFLKQRAEELGIYSMLGMSKKNITSILMTENTIIIGIACFVGMLISILFYSLIKVLLIVALKLDIPYLTHFTLSPFIITVVLSIFMLLVIFFDNYHLIKRLSILNISNLNQVSEKAVKTKSWTAYLGMIALLIAYVLVLDLVKQQQSLWVKIGFAPMAMISLVLVIIGTFLIIKSTLAYLLIVLSLVISAVIGLASTTFMLLTYPKASFMKTIPSAIEINQKLEPNQVTKVKQIARKYDGKFKATKVIKLISDKPIMVNKKQSTKKCKVINKQDYQELFKLQGNKKVPNLAFTKGTGYIYAFYKPNKSWRKVNINSIKFNLKEMHMWPMNAGYGYAYIVLNNQDFKKISKHHSAKMVYTVNGPNLRDNKQLYQDIKHMNIRFLSAYKKNKDAVDNNSATFLMEAFISVLFFVFIGCILYFTTLMETIEVTDEFRFLDNIGYSRKQLKKIASASNLLLFVPPAVMGLLNGLIAFIGFRYSFLENDVVELIGSFQIVGKPIIETCLLFLIVYGLIYIFSYHKTKVLLEI